MPALLISIFIYALPYLIITTTIPTGSYYHYTHFTDEETETQSLPQLVTGKARIKMRSFSFLDPFSNPLSFIQLFTGNLPCTSQELCLFFGVYSFPTSYQCTHSTQHHSTASVTAGIKQSNVYCTQNFFNPFLFHCKSPNRSSSQMATLPLTLWFRTCYFTSFFLT